MSTSDEQQRLRCLTDFKSVLLCEAAAGTGKTSLMAARIAMMLASGVRPAQIAALTFTEAAANELSRRIQFFIAELLEERVPPELEVALPQGLSESQAAELTKASLTLDELTSCTIHSFCLAIITDHAVDVGLDPGASVADEFVAASLFDQAFDEWLVEVLSHESTDDEAVFVLAETDPLGVVKRLRDLAELRNRNRDAQPTEFDPAARPDIELTDAIDAFGQWAAAHPQDGRTFEWLEQLQTLRVYYDGCLSSEPDFRTLWRLGQPPRLGLMLRESYGFREYQRRGSWKKLLGDQGENANAEATAHYQAVESRFADMLGYIANRMVCMLSDSLQGALDRYSGLKRRAALMDYDDLLDLACGLLRNHEPARRTVSERYRYIAVDEFQDTDTTQCEILFTIAAEERFDDWREATLRPGSLFLVGDAKQSIYRFRKADIAAYESARQVVVRQEGGAVVEITANFRSRAQILDFVNERFQPVFDGQQQPRYVALTATITDAEEDQRPAVAKLSISDPETSPSILRQLEAVAVADLCADLIGRFPVRRRNGTFSPATAGDIALLAPGHTDLWRYERELEGRQIAVASQAGKALMRRQETQDMLVLLRTLSDPSDQLAFGALLRGPLIGLTDHEIADIAASLPVQEGEQARLRLLVDSQAIKNDYARSAIELLQKLYRRGHDVTPSQLLAEAIEILGARLVVSARHASRNARALVNLDALIDRAGRYAVTGLRSFVRNLNGQWERIDPVQEGRSDTVDNAVHIVTMHSAKGLEWPIAIPIASATRFFPAPQFVHRRSDNSLHWVLGDLAPPALADARREEAVLQSRERQRMMYVVCTRARDLLVIPSMMASDIKSWSRAVRLAEDQLPEIDLSSLPERSEPAEAMAGNEQSAVVFSSESLQIEANAQSLVWKRPSSHDEKLQLDEVVAESSAFVGESSQPVGGGMLRGTLLHKLIEEVLTRETALDRVQLVDRAQQLLLQIASIEGDAGDDIPSPDEMADTTLAAFALPDVATVQKFCKAEVSVWDRKDGVLTAGRADALIVVDGKPVGVIDWKSDVAASADIKASYAAQVDDYLAATGAVAGVLVFLTTGELIWRGDRARLLELCGRGLAA